MNHHIEGIDEESKEKRVTLEELLRLKRHERPPAEFWEDFDISFKERTLQSVVRRKSWVGLLRNFAVNPWCLRFSAGLALVAFFLYFVPLIDFDDSTLTDRSVVSSPLPEAFDESAVMVATIGASDEVEFIEDILTLRDALPSDIEMAFPSNDLHVVSSDSTIYAEESLTTLLGVSASSNHQVIF